MKKFIDKNLSREILYLFILKNKTFLPFEKFSQFFNLKIFFKNFQKIKFELNFKKIKFFSNEIPKQFIPLILNPRIAQSSPNSHE